MYLGRAFPTDLLGAIVLGWGVAAAVHFAFGTPDRRPTVAQVHRALARLGVAVTRPPPRCRPAGRASAVRRRDTTDGPDPGHRDRPRRSRRAVHRSRCGATSRTARRHPLLFPTRRQQVEYEAYVELLARDRGVARAGHRRRGIGHAGSRSSSRRSRSGRSLGDLAPKAKLTDALLRSRLARGRPAPRRAHRARRARRGAPRDRRAGTDRRSWGSRRQSTSADVGPDALATSHSCSACRRASSSPTRALRRRSDARDRRRRVARGAPATSSHRS